LQGWFDSDRPSTVAELNEAFGERTFAIAIALLMAPTALPIPTAGLTHIFEVISAILALELIAGRRTPWLPKRLTNRELPANGKFAEGLIRWLARIERFTRPRLSGVMQSRAAGPVYGLIALALVVIAAIAPPFSGLDTLPGLGVVLISLGVVFGDALFAIAGIVIGAIGSLLIVVLGKEAVDLFQSIF
jgi:hypothetical protein